MKKYCIKGLEYSSVIVLTFEAIHFTQQIMGSVMNLDIYTSFSVLGSLLGSHSRSVFYHVQALHDDIVGLHLGSDDEVWRLYWDVSDRTLRKNYSLRTWITMTIMMTEFNMPTIQACAVYYPVYGILYAVYCIPYATKQLSCKKAAWWTISRFHFSNFVFAIENNFPFGI